MKALTYHGFHDIRVANLPQPDLQQPTDALIRVTQTAICGSDLHLTHNLIPNLPAGMVMGHETMGIVAAAGAEVKSVRPGDRVVVAFPIACGHCFYCQHEQFSLCDDANPDGENGAIFGYGTQYGGYDGGQAEYLRVPFADVGLLKIPDELTDEQVLFLSDILPTGWWGCEAGGVQKGDDVVVMGCGPVGLMTMMSAWLHGAKRVFAVDHLPYRLEAAQRICGAEPINLLQTHVGEAVKERTDGKGADVAIDAVGLEATMSTWDKIETFLKIDSGSIAALSQAIQAVRRGGSIGVVGVYGGRNNFFPWGEIFAKGLRVQGGQAPVQRYWRELLQHIKAGRLHPEQIITHRMDLSEGPRGYAIFDQKQDDCIKVVLTP
jgi:S-(hydroxymethyl)glutathione dehydrogenase / alcohol dehydrogenase